LSYEFCEFCCGSGQVPDDKSTAGNKPCPVCFGSKTVLKSIDFD